MTDPSEEMLMAYADGELDPQAHARMAAIIANRPDLQERVAMFASTGRTLGTLFDQPMREPVPQRLVDAVAPPASGTRTSSAHAQGAWARLLDVIGFSDRALRQAFAYASVLIVGVALGWYIGSVEVPSTVGERSAGYALSRSAQGPLGIGPVLARALDFAPSGTRLDLVGGPAGEAPMRASLILSFTNAGDFCRQYEIAVQGGQGAAGLACRDKGKRWRLVAQAPADVPFELPAAARPSQYRAGPVADIVKHMMRGEPLDASEEAVHLGH